MRHAILGMGGVGGFIAAALAHGGDEVTAIVRADALATYPATLSLTSAYGDLTVPLARAAAVDGDFDVLWVTVKATQLESALQSVRHEARVAAVVPLLNGIDHVASLRVRFGAAVVPATIAIEAERVAPAVIVHRSPFAIVSVTRDGTARLDGALAKLRALGATTRTVDDEATVLWSKLVFLAPLALTTTAAMAPIGEVLANDAERARLEGCVDEACAAAAAAGAVIDPAFVVRGLAAMPPSLRSSMMKDVTAGLPPELDAIAGPIVRGTDAPITRDLVERVRARIR